MLERPDEADVVDLVAWLATAPRPAAPFQLAMARVVGVDRLYEALRADAAEAT